ncbi:MAG TPA: DUF4440 domain-containing protein [Rhizomicrobium sp.]
MRALARFILSMACVLSVSTSAFAAPSKAEIASTIKANVAALIAGINAHDVARATQFDAPDFISMESMRPPSVGADADKAGLGMVFKIAPGWRLQMIDETVDVADAGDIAIYRSTYNENSVGEDGTPMTHKVNYIAEFRHDPEGWRIHWSVVCAQERSHKV